MKRLMVSITLVYSLLVNGQNKSGMLPSENKNLVNAEKNFSQKSTVHQAGNSNKSNSDCALCHNFNKKTEKNLTDSISTGKKILVYTKYRNRTLLKFPGDNCTSFFPDGTSSMCLSCHDGIVSSDVLGQRKGGALANDISVHHPISVDYMCCYNNGRGDLRPVSWNYYTAYDPSTGKYTASSNPALTVASRLDEYGKVQCTSCHCEHNNTGKYLLCMNNQGSLLCIVCHNN